MGIRGELIKVSENYNGKDENRTDVVSMVRRFFSPRGSDDPAPPEVKEEPASVSTARNRRFHTAEPTIRLTATVGEKTNKALELVAQENGMTKSAAVNYILAKGFVIEGFQARGAIIQAVFPDGEVMALKEASNADWVNLMAVTLP